MPSVVILAVCLTAILLLFHRNRRLNTVLTRQKRYEKELLGEKKRYETLVNNLPQAVFWKDSESRYISVNKTFAQLLKRRIDDLAGRPESDFFPPDLARKFRESDEQVLASGETFEVVEPIVLHNKERWVHTFKTPVTDSEGDTQGVLGIFWDITEQKQAQDQLKETQRFNESVMRSTLDMVYIYDREKDLVVYTNPHLSELLGYESEEIHAMGGKFHGRLVHPDDVWILEDMFARCEGHEGEKIEQAEFRMHDAIGRWLWFQGRYTVFNRNRDGKVSQIIGTLHDITERVTVENALKIAFDRAQRYLDIVETIILALDRDGHITLINRKGAQMLGYRPSELVGRNLFESFIIEEDRRDSALYYGSVLSGDASVMEYLENRIVNADGEQLIIAWHNTLLKDEHDKVIGFLCAGEDITQRKIGVELLKTEKLRQNMLLTLNQLPDLTVEHVMNYALETALVLTKSQIGYLYFYSEEDRLFTLFCWSGEAMENCHVKEKQTLYKLEKTGLWGEAVRQRKPMITNDYQTENTYKRGVPEGHVPLKRHANLPVFDAGKIVAVIGVANKEELYSDTDMRHLQVLMDGVWKIKKRIEMEEQIRLLNEELEHKVEQRTSELKRMHEELSQFFVLTLDLLCIINDKGEFLRCNKAWETMLGYQPEDLEGKPVVDFIASDDRKTMKMMLSGFSTTEESIEVVNRFLHADGSLRWLEWRINTFGNVVYAAARNVTDKKQYEEKLITAKEEADRANKAKSRFLATISHEIRTPLNAVIGYSELLATMALGKKAHEYVNSITLAGRNLLKLINDILDLSKVEAAMVTMRYGAVNLEQIVSEIEQVFSFKLHEKNLEFSIEIDPKLPCYLVLDEVRLRQVLLNLVGNAVKFTEEGYVKVIVNCIPSVEGISKIDAEIIVEDSGIGVHLEDREKIFEAFQQQNDLPQQYGGTGLGLSISRKLLQMMNGTVMVENGPKGGSRFIVHLKDVAIASVAPSEDVKEWTLTGEQEHKTPTTILVVDDIPSNREMIAALLSDSGLTVLEAHNGEAAVKCALEKKPSCIIMDILMPVMDGAQAAQILKKKSETAGIPIIALTTMSRDSVAFGRDLSMFDGTLGKPVSSHDLFDELGRHLPGVREVSSQSLDKLFEQMDNTESGALPDEFHQKAFVLLGAVKMDDVRDFAGSLITFATGNHRSGLRLIGKKLGEYADHFDITGVRKILRKIAGSMAETVENN